MLTSVNSKMPDALNTAYQLAYDNWSWLHLRQSFISNALYDLLFSIVMTLIFMVLTTQNFYISLIAALCISSIILCMMTVIWAKGWKFGMIESTSLIVFVGISVDYVVHICHQYIHAVEQDRKGRMEQSYNQIGRAVIGGSLTSCFSAFFLIICEASALSKFGVLLLTIILSSMVTSLVYLPSVVFIMGPEKDQGKIKCQ